MRHEPSLTVLEPKLTILELYVDTGTYWDFWASYWVKVKCWIRWDPCQICTTTLLCKTKPRFPSKSSVMPTMICHPLNALSCFIAKDLLHSPLPSQEKFGPINPEWSSHLICSSTNPVRKILRHIFHGEKTVQKILLSLMSSQNHINPIHPNPRQCNQYFIPWGVSENTSLYGN